MTWLLCGLATAVPLLAACWLSERLRRVAIERERDAFRRVAVDVVGRVGAFCDARPESVSVLERAG